MNKDTSLTWIPNTELGQGVFAFFISSPNRNSSESPFFALQVTNSTSPGLSRATKVGIGLGIPLAFALITLVALMGWLMLRRVRERRREQEDSLALETSHGEPQIARKEIVELGGKSVGPELDSGVTCQTR